ncbi:OLC1v1016471C1 [Oldenlandia corymbosa var. corymbosa]|uniref:OLC1v1016471C1 n=1 Tax=Oldenlandia corymbosa var. corymbosa TaxID=529605 RepID=A0AAV1E6W7_OLDCO|nr:OLC1v1016471C1 [Oldenlandia corymbosa var. corymbosa]
MAEAGQGPFFAQQQQRLLLHHNFATARELFNEMQLDNVLEQLLKDDNAALEELNLALEDARNAYNDARMGFVIPADHKCIVVHGAQDIRLFEALFIDVGLSPQLECELIFCPSNMDDSG